MDLKLAAGSLDEVCLFLARPLMDSKLAKNVQKVGVSLAPFDSDLHFSGSILIERVKKPKKVANPGFLEQNSKVVVLFVEGGDVIAKAGELERCLSRYQQIEAKVVLILQNTAEFLGTAQLTLSQDQGRLESYQEWLAGLTLQRVDAFETRGFKESAGVLLRVVKTLIQGPYKSTVTAFSSSSRKFSSQTVISEGSQLWANSLINIPGISEQKAKHITQKYPTMRALLEAYDRHDLSRLHKENLLTDLGDGKKHKKLSARLHLFLTSCDGTQSLA
jgi:hypothetical protein